MEMWFGLSLVDLILKVVKENEPKSVKELIQLVQQKSDFPKEEILTAILELNSEGKLNFSTLEPVTKPKRFQFFIQTLWYWLTLLLVVATSLSIFIPETSYPLVYVRYLFGSILILFLPGFTIIKLIFPTKETFSIERFAQSIGVSLAFVPVIGLLLNYTEGGITTTSATVSQLILTMLFATVAVVRQYYIRKNEKPPKQ